MPNQFLIRPFAPVLILFSNVARAGSQWVLLWFFAIVGGAEIVGEYSVALAVATPVFIVLDLSIRNVFVTLKSDVVFTKYLRLRIFTTAISFATLGVLAVCGVAAPGVLMLIGAIKAVDSLLELAYGSLQKASDLQRIAWTSLLNSAVTVVLGVSIFALTENVEFALAGSLIGSVVTTTIVFIPLLKASRISNVGAETDTAGIGKVIRAGIPSGLAYASASLLTYLPVYFLNATATPTAVGIFAVLAYFPVFANLLFASAQQVTLNNFVLHYKARGAVGLRKYALRILVRLELAGMALTAGTWIFGGAFIRLAYGQEFSISQSTLIPVALSLALLPVVYVSGAVLLTRNRYSVQLLTATIALGMTTIVGLFMIEAFTLASASALVLVGTACRAVLSGAAAALTLIAESRSPERLSTNA